MQSTKAEMTPERLWPVVLVALFITPIQSLNCVYLDNTTLESVKLLGSIIRSPLKCLKEIKDFEFPKEILPHIQHVERDMKEAFYLISIQALNIFSQDSYISHVTRERLQHIRMGLFEQVQQALDCFMDEEKEDSKTEHPRPKYPQRVYLELSKYFIKIKKFLGDKKYSFCAWEIVGAEVRRCFMIFYNFKRLLKIQSGKVRDSNTCSSCIESRRFTVPWDAVFCTMSVIIQVRPTEEALPPGI